MSRRYARQQSRLYKQLNRPIENTVRSMGTNNEYGANMEKRRDATNRKKKRNSSDSYV